MYPYFPLLKVRWPTAVLPVIPTHRQIIHWLPSLLHNVLCSIMNIDILMVIMMVFSVDVAFIACLSIPGRGIPHLLLSLRFFLTWFQVLWTEIVTTMQTALWSKQWWWFLALNKFDLISVWWRLCSLVCSHPSLMLNPATTVIQQVIYFSTASVQLKDKNCNHKKHNWDAKIPICTNSHKEVWLFWYEGIKSDQVLFSNLLKSFLFGLGFNTSWTGILMFLCLIFFWDVSASMIKGNFYHFFFVAFIKK